MVYIEEICDGHFKPNNTLLDGEYDTCDEAQAVADAWNSDHKREWKKATVIADYKRVY